MKHTLPFHVNADRCNIKTYFMYNRKLNRLLFDSTQQQICAQLSFTDICIGKKNTYITGYILHEIVTFGGHNLLFDNLNFG